MRTLFATLFLIVPVVASADPFTVKTENVERDRGTVSATFSATNNTEKPESVFVQCVFYNGETPVDTVLSLVTNVQPLQRKISTARLPTNEKITGSLCEFDKVSTIKF